MDIDQELNDSDSEVQGPLAHLFCSICQHLLKNAVSTICGHTFCEKCLICWRVQGRITCPQCRELVPEHNIHPVFSLRSFINDFNSVKTRKMSKTSDNYATWNASINKSICNAQSSDKDNFDGATMTIPSQYSSIDQNAMVTTGSTVRNWDQHEVFPEFDDEEQRNQSVRKLREVSERLSKLDEDMISIQGNLHRNKLRSKALEQRLSLLSSSILAENLTGQYLRDELVRFPDIKVKINMNNEKKEIDALRTFISQDFLSFHPNESYEDINDVFHKVSRCFTAHYQNKFLEWDIRMLVATAFASDWFDTHQHESLRQMIFKFAK